MPRMIPSKSSVALSVPAGQSITVFCQDSAQVYQIVDSVRTPLGTVTGSQQTFGPFAGGADIVIESDRSPVFWGIGTAPVLQEFVIYKIQRAPFSISGSGSLTVASLFGALINANAGLLGATGTLPTGAQLDASSDFKMDDSFDWNIMSTGLGTFSVGASAGHTIVGAAGVGSTQSGAFRTRKTGTNAFVTYRIG